jgi:epoxyqueuosine reductase
LARELALAAGFDAAGMAVLEPLDQGVEGERLRVWLDGERHGSMAYMARDPGRRLDPGAVFPGARSILCVGLNYGNRHRGEGGENGAGRVARYAWGRDYHKVFSRRLKRLEEMLAEEFPGVRTQRYVDTGPVMEKLWAERAGLGWRGKHTNLLSHNWGSWLLLGEVLLDLELEPDTPATDHCGRCARCIDVCPTRAITGPYQLDARLCISYLTIEHRGTIPKELRPLMGDHVFGCDDCLDVCPWNRFARNAREAEFRPRPEVMAPLLVELVTLDDEGFLERFAGTALMRPKREGMARNACIALGNVGGPGAAEALGCALGDQSPLVREHAAWGLGRLGDGAAREVLQRARETEVDLDVLATIEEALEASLPA